MLKQLRNKKTAKRIWLGLAVIIVPAFVLWGVGGGISGRKESVPSGRLAGHKIREAEYGEALAAVKNTAIIQFGDKFQELESDLNLKELALQRVILLIEAKKNRIKVTDKEVVEAIRNYPFFQTRGKFDDRIYSQMLRYVFRTQARIFEEETRGNLMIMKLFQKLTDNIKVTQEQVKEEYRKANEEISLFYISSLTADFAKNISPTQEQLKSYFEKNRLNFKQPLSFNIEYLLLPSEEKVKEAAAAAKKEGFEKIAKNLGMEIKESGFFTSGDPIPGIGWSPQIPQMLTSLKVGQYISIKNDNNYYLLRLKEKRESYLPDFSQIAGKAKDSFITESAREAAKGKITECLKELKTLQDAGQKIDFSKAAAKSGLKSGSTELFKFGSYIEGIGASDSFWMEAEKLKNDAFSGVIDMPEGFYIIKVKERVSVDEKKFAKDMEGFSKQITFVKKQEYFSKYIAGLMKQIQ